jgi:uncharacterized protein YjbI with pentapeptide repeats
MPEIRPLLLDRSFRGQDLRGADFRNADIRSVDFRQAQLQGADFSNARAGLSLQWQIIHFIAVCVIAALTGGMAGYFGNWSALYLNPNYLQQFSAFPGMTILLIALLALPLTAWRGTTLNTASSIVGAGFTAGLLTMLVATLWMGADLGRMIAIAVAIAVAGAGAASTACTVGLLLSVSAIALPLGVRIGVVGIVGTVATMVSRSGAGAGTRAVFTAVAMLIAMGVIPFGIYFQMQALRGALRFQNLLRAATWLASLGGTQFQDADLSDAIFAQAYLKGSNFQDAVVKRTIWRQARLDFAWVEATMLDDPKVRSLLVTGQGQQQSYCQCDLAGAYLLNANLVAANLAATDLSGANLRGANLSQANLNQVQALGTDFQSAHLTAACIAAWNIDQHTQLEAVECDYVYLKNDYQDRHPPQGDFAPGDFTQLFQIVVNTIELIFHDRIDFQQLEASLKIVQAKYPSQPLEIKRIDKKGDQLVVVEVRVAEDADKAAIYADLTATYTQLLKTLETRYEAELAAKEELLTVYRQMPQIKPLLGKRVVLKLEHGTFASGFTVVVQIGAEGEVPFAEYRGALSPTPELFTLYHQWRTCYRTSMGAATRISIDASQVTHLDIGDRFAELALLSQQLQQAINDWFNHETFRPIQEQLFHHLDRRETIRFMVQSDDPTIPYLPLQTWNFFQRYPNAELAYSPTMYERSSTAPTEINRLKVLAILGDRRNITIDQDQSLLQQLLPQASVQFLDSPNRQELNDVLWSEQWNILFFAGHSVTDNTNMMQGRTGKIHINESEVLTIDELRHALRKAIAQGLKLVIFNSCDGLGLAFDLADLHIPQVIVMREPVPDRVAQLFLQHFLTAFSKGVPLYKAVRESREKLQGIEDRFLGASWLPVIWQNPAEMPLQYHVDHKM